MVLRVRPGPGTNHLPIHAASKVMHHNFFNCLRAARVKSYIRIQENHINMSTPDGIDWNHSGVAGTGFTARNDMNDVWLGTRFDTAVGVPTLQLRSTMSSIVKFDLRYKYCEKRKNQLVVNFCNKPKDLFLCCISP